MFLWRWQHQTKENFQELKALILILWLLWGVFSAHRSPRSKRMRGVGVALIHSIKSPDNINPNSTVVSLKRIAEEWWKRALDKMAIMGDGCSRSEFSRAGAWWAISLEISSFKLHGWLSLHLFWEKSDYKAGLMRT